MKEPVDHILRPRLPWRPLDEGPITECGYDATKIKTVTRTEYFKREKDLGKQRNAMLTCMTCADAARRWGAWEDDPRLAMQREIEWERKSPYWSKYVEDDRGVRLKDELLAIASLIDSHRDEFFAAVAEIEQRRAWNEKKAALADRPKPKSTSTIGGL